MMGREFPVCKNHPYHSGFDDIFSRDQLSVRGNMEFLCISYFREEESIELMKSSTFSHRESE